MDKEKLRKTLTERICLPRSYRLSDGRHPLWSIIRIAVHGTITLVALNIIVHHLTDDTINHAAALILGLDIIDIVTILGLLGIGSGGLEYLKRGVTRDD